MNELSASYDAIEFMAALMKASEAHNQELKEKLARSMAGLDLALNPAENCYCDQDCKPCGPCGERLMQAGLIFQELKDENG